MGCEFNTRSPFFMIYKNSCSIKPVSLNILVFLGNITGVKKDRQKQPNKSSALVGQSKGLFLVVAALIVLATLGVYWQVGNHEFITYDDDDYIIENSHVQSGLTLAEVKWAFTTGHAANWHPLTWLSYMVDCELFGLDAGGHHIVNVLFHLANTVLLFWVLFRMTGGLWPSAFVAALFALHPLHVESVAWIAERKDVLSTFFWMLTMWAYLRYTERKCAGRYLLVVLVFALGLMAKPMLVTLPFVLLLLDYWPLERLEFTQPISKVKSNIFALILEKVPLFVLALIASVVTFMVQKSGRAVVETKDLPIYLRIENATVSYVCYLGKMVWPEKLAVLYPLPWDSLKVWQIAGAAGLLVCITGLVIWLRGRRWLTVGWLWYLGTLVPMIGIVQVGSQAMADRYTYVPLIGIFIMIAWTASELIPKWRWRNLALGVLAVAILCGFSLRTWIQVGYWSDSVTLYKRSVSVTRDNHSLLASLANDLAEQNKTKEAIYYLSKYLRIRPYNVDAHANIASFLGAEGRFGEATKHFEKAIELDPNHVLGHEGFGVLLSRQGKHAEAVKHFKKAINLSPDDVGIRHNFVLMLNGQKRYDEAIATLSEILRIEPDYAEAYSLFGFIYSKQGRVNKAIENYEKALQLDPSISITRADIDKLLVKAEKAEVHYERAVGFHKEGNFKQAIFHYRTALALNSDYLSALNNLARVLATCENEQFRDTVEAVGFAKRTCELTNYKEAKMLDTLAVAYAATDEFAEAVSVTKKAIELAKASGDDELANDLQERIKLYKTNQPYLRPAKK